MYWHKTPWWLQWIYPGLEWHGSRDSKNLYLTFDDGPIPEETPFILETLKRYNIKATFFCVGDNVRKHSSLFTQLVDAGHSIGNHTMHHVKGWGMDTDSYLEEVQACRQEIARHGIDTTLFRPPYGKASRKQLRHLGDYRVIMWDVLSGDFDERLSPDICLKETKAATRNGSYILFHDNEKAHERLHFALPRFIESMVARGYEFKAL